MKSTIRVATLAASGIFVVAAMAASGLAQNASGSIAAGVNANGVTEFRDERTGKVWTPENVSQDDKLGPAAPSSALDRAFDPRTQLTAVEGVTVQKPRANSMGVVPITAGPSVPIVTLDGASPQAVPAARWLTVLYVTNNSANVIDIVVSCLFTNADRKVEDTRVIIPSAGPGERLGFPVYGPRVDMFVDRVTCGVIAPT